MTVKDLLLVIFDEYIKIENWDGLELYSGHQDNTFLFLIYKKIEMIKYNEKEHIYILTVE